MAANGHPQRNGAHSDEDEGEVILDGDVVDDLEGQDLEYGSDGDDEEEEGMGGEQGDHPILEDDSIHCFEGHQDAVVAVAWSPAHADLVATGGCDDTAFMWRVGQEALEETAGTMGTHELAGHTDTVAAVAFNSTGTLLASAGMDGVCRVWRCTDGKLAHTLEGSGGALEWLRWHPRGDIVVAGTEDCLIYMWNAATGAVMQVFSGHGGVVNAGEFSPDGKALLSVGGAGDSTLRVWNPRNAECTHTIQGFTFHETGINCLAIHSDGAAVITGGDDGTVCLSNIQSGRVVGRLSGHEDSVEAVGFSAHLPLAASAGLDGKLLVWDCGSMGQRSACEHPSSVTRIAWHPTQPLVFTGCLDGAARCWDLRTATCVRTYGGHEDAIQDMCLSPDGSMLLTGADDNTARVFRTSP